MSFGIAPVVLARWPIPSAISAKQTSSQGRVTTERSFFGPLRLHCQRAARRVSVRRDAQQRIYAEELEFLVGSRPYRRRCKSSSGLAPELVLLPYELFTKCVTSVPTVKSTPKFVGEAARVKSVVLMLWEMKP